jgi:BMFP domain-containing protein YqiC
MMDQLPALDKLSGSEKDALIQMLWAEVQALKARITQLEAQLQAPKKGSHNSSVPHSKTAKASRGQV